MKKYLVTQLKRIHRVGTASKRNQYVYSLVLTLVGLGLGLTSEMALAQSLGGGLPWEGPICSIAKSLSGPVAKAGSVIAIAGTGLMLAFGEIGGVFATGLKILFGLSLALGITSWLPAMFGTSLSFGCVGL